MAPKILKALADVEAEGLTWTIEQGKKHRQVRINGRMATILPTNGGRSRSPFDTQNVITSIRRLAREIINDGEQ
jgi:hypothetical protein